MDTRFSTTFSMLCIIMLAFATSCSNKSEKMSDSDYVNLAQEKIDNCKSGHIRMKYSHRFDNEPRSRESVFDIEFYFMKDSTGSVKSFYSTVKYDTVNTENLFFNDTVTSLDNGAISRCLYFPTLPQYYEYKWVKNGNLTKIFGYDSISCTDTIINQNMAAIISADKYNETGSVFRTHEHCSYIIGTDGTLYATTYCYEELMLPNATSAYKHYYDHIDIEEITLYNEINPDIESLINNKRSELSSFTKPETTLSTRPNDDSNELTIEHKPFPEKAYNWQLPTYNGDSLSSIDIKSKIMFVGFYDLTDPFSITEEIFALHCMKLIDSTYNDNDVCVVGINIGDKETDKARAILESGDIKFNNAMGNSLAQQYNLKSCPYFLIIDCATNKIIYHQRGSYGYENYGANEYMKVIDEALERIKG